MTTHETTPDDAAAGDDPTPGEAVYRALLERTGEGDPQPRLAPTRRAVELLGDPQRAYPIIHLTGTNGKTSTSRITESILRAYGLRTGLLSSPHLVRFNERIVIDGEPISDEALARNWADVVPYLEMVDAELAAADEVRLTFFEALTVLAFASFADAPVDVAVIEVGMGGEWDSTNVGDGQVAVLTPISLDHTRRLGNTIAEIARTKSGIIKPAATVVSATQAEAAANEIRRAAALSDATLVTQGAEFALLDAAAAVGGQLLTVRGRAGTYRDLFLPLYGSHQAQNAAVAIAAVEAFLGDGGHELDAGVLAEGLGQATSPGRLQLLGSRPPVIVDAAHNPAGAAALAGALREFFRFDQIAFVLAVLRDKDAAGIVEALGPLAAHFHVTQTHSERSRPAAELAADVADWSAVPVTSAESVADAVDAARRWARAGEGRAVVVAGSIVLAGEVIALAAAEDWASDGD